MDELATKIKKIRLKNFNSERRYFIPEPALREAVSKPTVESCLRILGIPVQEIPDLVDGILQGGLRCLAILILIGHGKAIANFFKRDSLQRSRPDDRLPYTSDGLQQIFNEDIDSPIIGEFLEKQWEFAIPILHQNMISRQLDTQAILPFLHEEPAGRGSMGTAWKTELHPQCHQLPLEDHKVVRKQLECGDGDDAVFQKEVENLSLLTHLKHPNIVQLHCSYVYRQRYNLIFSVADGGSLADFLNGEGRSQGLHGPKLLQALAGLASAIDSMHNFTSEALNLGLSGCHHDLAPRNILIHRETFLLSDFGLSTLRNADQDSLTAFKEVRGSYIAPECQTIQQDGQIKSQKIRRASDIWSFGCILAEVLTYMFQGPRGVAVFRDKRKVQVTPEIAWFRFHQGTAPNPAVTDWLDDLESNGEVFCVRLVRLIRAMLEMEHTRRPSSARVLVGIRGVVIVSLATSINLALDEPRSIHPSTDIMLDKLRYQSWLFAFERLLDDVDQSRGDEVRYDYSTIVQALEETLRILKSSTESPCDPKYQQPSILRYQYTKLMESLPLDYRSTAEDWLISQVLETADVDRMDQLSVSAKQAGDKDIGALVAIKRLITLAGDGSLFEQSDLIIDRKEINVTYHLDDLHSLILPKSSSQPAIVEWLRYKEHWADDDVGPELRRRLESMVGLLHTDSSLRIPGSLHCRGVFHDPSTRAFGIVYDHPSPGTQAVTLHHLLRQEKAHLPVLEDRFRLAFDICRFVYKFHKVGWLHRNLHSMNVMFFPKDGVKKAEWAREPRILGFAYSRENISDSFTHGPEDDLQLRNYQHPEYLKDRVRYRQEFDYYSVGVLLLEIGHWQPLSKLTGSSRFRDISEEQFRREIIAQRVPQLAFNMGTSYMEATRRCLEGGFMEPQEDPRREGQYGMFKRMVMDQILQQSFAIIRPN